MEPEDIFPAYEKAFTRTDGRNTLIVEFGDLTSLSDDKQYGNFEIKVPEIDDDVMEEGAVLAYIERAATEERPKRWSQFPQYNPDFFLQQHSVLLFLLVPSYLFFHNKYPSCNIYSKDHLDFL